MAVQSYSLKINRVNLYKFHVLKSGIPTVADKINSLDIYPQVHEITIYESIFNPIVKAEIAVIDYIGMFVNFPLTGNEIIQVETETVDTGVGAVDTKTWTFAIESITDITPDDKNRAVGFVINCMAIEGLANGLATVKQAFEGTSGQIAKNIFQEHIIDRIRKFYPAYKGENIHAEANETRTMTFVVPNVYPINAINLVQSLTTSEVSNHSMYLFFQNSKGFNFTSIQNLTQGNNALRKAINNKYIYLSDEIGKLQSNKMNNEERIVSNITINKRHASTQKLAMGYFNNNLFEVNIAQKAIHSTRTKTEDVLRMFPHGFDTADYVAYADSVIEGDEDSNNTMYMLTSRKEEDKDFPILRLRDRWGKDIISKIALGQVDLTIVIPGTNRFAAGDMFYLEIPEFHGFEDVKMDDLIGGYFLITDVKQIIQIGGFQSTVLRLNKDSYNKSSDRPSRYVE